MRTPGAARQGSDKIPTGADRTAKSSGRGSTLDASRQNADRERADVRGRPRRRPRVRRSGRERVAERFGQADAIDAERAALDIVVDNAGVQTVAPVGEFGEAQWSLISAINLTSAVLAGPPGMKARRWGRIINVSSAHGLFASPFKSAYGTAKHGVTGLTRAVALEAAEHDVASNAIPPGSVPTPLVEWQSPETARPGARATRRSGATPCATRSGPRSSSLSSNWSAKRCSRARTRPTPSPASPRRSAADGRRRERPAHRQPGLPRSSSARGARRRAAGRRRVRRLRLGPFWTACSRTTA